MKFDGTAYAQALYEKLRKTIEENTLTPHLAVILVGENKGSLSYIRQKRKWAEYIGATLTLYQYAEAIGEEVIIQKIMDLNNDSTVQGIIVQLPLPKHLNERKLTQLVIPEKDIDGFHTNSPFIVPIAKAIIKLLEEITQKHDEELIFFLKSHQIVVLGHGKTAGEPIISHLQSLGVTPIVIDHGTITPTDITKQADIIISCVGKENIITRDMIKEGSVVIGVGLFSGEDGKLKGDFNEEDIAKIASWYTPTPGGVGPINVACLLENLVIATK